MSARVLALAAALLVAAPSVPAAGPPDADAAFEAGEYDRALSLYDEALAANPDDVHALVRSGMLLSWSKRFDEAIARYDRVLALDPDQPTALLERAKVLSWSGRQSEARAAYERLLAADAGDPVALLGVAQTYDWSGDDGRARPAYLRALAADPGSKYARLGLAYLDLRQGDPAAAGDRAASLRADHPDDPEVEALARAIAKARAPWIRLGGDRLDDTDDNTLTTWTLEGGLGFTRGLDLRLGVARYDMETLDEDGAIDSVWAVLGWAPARRHRVEARVGADVQRPSTGDDDTVAIGGLLYRFPLGGRWNGRVSWARDSYRYSAPILDNGIVIDAYDARVDGAFADAWRVEAGVGAWSLDDGNDRKAADGSILHGWKVGRHTLEAGYGLRWFDWNEDPGNGYFAPSNFLAHLALGRARGPLGAKGYFDLAAEAGVQSFTQGDRRVSADPAFGVTALAGRPLGAGFDLEGYAAWSTSAPQGGENYRARRFGFRLRYTFGEER